MLSCKPKLVVLLVVSFVFITFSHAQNNELKTVVSEGIGRDTAEAAQNAAQNALTNIVGSFIDSKTELEKKVQIQEGLKQQTKNIKTNIKEYSQGVIQKFEIIKVTNADGFFKVSAKVTVKVDDFKVYIKKMAKVEIEVDEGLFAEIKTENKQKRNSSSLIYEKILLPLINGDGLVFSASAPKPLRQMGLDGIDLNQYLQANSNLSIVGFSVQVKSIEGFEQNTKKILDSIAKKKISLGLINEDRYSWEFAQKVHIPPDFIYQRDFSLALLHTEPGKHPNLPSKLIDAYLIDNSKIEFSKIAPWTTCLMGSNSCEPNFQGQIFSRGHPTPIQNLHLEILNKEGKPLQRELVTEKNPSGGNSIWHSQSNRMLVVGTPTQFFSSHWSLVGGDYSGGQSLLLVRDASVFVVLLAVDELTIKNAKSFVLKLAD
jgi:hypothetical protein